MTSLADKPHLKRNLQRDLLRFSRRFMKVSLKCYWCKAIVRNQHGLASVLTWKPILLPHELLGAIYLFDGDLLDSTLGDVNAASTYWWEVIRSSPPWFKEHKRYADIKRNPKAWRPLKLFGDDARLGKTRSILVVHMFSPCASRKATSMSELPIFIRNGVDIIPGVTDRDLWECLHWSFRILESNVYPKHGFYGEPLTGFRRV